MRLKFLNIPCALLCICTTFTWAATAQDTDTVPVRDFVKIVLVDQLRPFVEYCAEAAPNTSDDIWESFESFAQVLEVTADQYFDSVVTSSLREIPADEFDKIVRDSETRTAEGMETVRQLPVDSICPEFHTKLKTTSVEKMLEVLQSSTEAYQLPASSEAAVIAVEQDPDWPDRLKPSDYIDPDDELSEIADMDGTWIGNLQIVHDPAGANREYPDGYPIRIDIDGEEASLFFIEEGDVLDPFPGDTLLAGVLSGSALIFYLAESETFMETWSISLNHVAPNQAKGFISRSVHNFAVRRDSPWRAFPVYATADFERQQ